MKLRTFGANQRSDLAMLLSFIRTGDWCHRCRSSRNVLGTGKGLAEVVSARWSMAERLGVRGITNEERRKLSFDRPARIGLGRAMAKSPDRVVECPAHGRAGYRQDRLHLRGPSPER